VQLFDLIVFKFGSNQMETVVDGGFAFRFLMPVVDTLDKRLTFVLHGEIDDGGSASVSSCSSTSEKVIRRLSTAKRKLHMRVRIDPTRDNQPAFCIDHFVDFHFQLCADDGNLFVFDQDVSAVVVGSRDDAAVSD
jgi:hypothetical protein